MKTPFGAGLPALDTVRLQQQIQQALAAGGLGQAPFSRAARAGPPAWPGEVQAHRFSSHAGSRSYQLYIPASADRNAVPRPLLVMLHGCKQSAADFAAGTGMNRLAEAHGALVVYPEQAVQANQSACWNWFSQAEQRRDGPEPSLIAGIVREVAQRHGADARRIYVAGLSAGAAMAVVMGQTYPELFAGVGAHSGLPFACAADVASALAAMKGGRGRTPGLRRVYPPAASAPAQTPRFVPTIVIHGDRDHTVQHDNGEQIVRQALAAHAGQPGHAALVQSSQRCEGPGGRSFTRRQYVDGSGSSRIEAWTLHGAGHAWSGGDPAGSYTDGAGPDASAAMLAFFLALPPVQAV